MSFYGLEIAKSALFIGQQGINMAGHNIANAGTEGYTRQRLLIQSIDPADLSGRFATLSKSAVGAGANIQSVSQVRNAYVDRALRKEYADLGQYETRANEMEYLEELFDETNKSSISTTLSEFFNSLQELTKDTISKEIRTEVQQTAVTLTQTFNHYYTQLSELQTQMNDSMNVTVNRINEISRSLAAFNKSIHSYELDGDQANDLRDQRSLLMDELSTLVNITYSEDADGRLTVKAGDAEIVNHASYTELEAVADQTGIVTGTTGFYRVCVKGAVDAFGNPVEVSYNSGELEGFRQLRDGDDSADVGIPHLINSLNVLARGLAQKFNELHSTGYTLAYDSTPSITGVNLFDVPVDGGGNADYSLITAGNFSLSDEVLDDVNMIAASDTLIDLSSGNSQSSNNEIAKKLAELTNSTNMIAGTSFEGYLQGMVVELAVGSSYCTNLLESQQAVTENLEARKESISGVSVDEEMISLIKFQHMYSAASRVINAVDEALEKLINGTGVVGR